jgi:5-carboxymethyl-2-hydroxymuconate isomerase
MPHITIEYSSNVAEHCDIGALVEVVHERARATEVAPLAGIRTRAVAREFYRIADGNPAHGFVSLHAQLGPGRTPEVKKDLLVQLLEAMNEVLGPVQESNPLAISAKLTEIDAEYRINQNNVGDHL